MKRSHFNKLMDESGRSLAISGGHNYLALLIILNNHHQKEKKKILETS